MESTPQESPSEAVIATARLTATAVIDDHSENLPSACASSVKRKCDIPLNDCDQDLKRNRRNLEIVEDLPTRDVDLDDQNNHGACAATVSEDPDLSDCSHHTADLMCSHNDKSSSGSDSESGFGLFDPPRSKAKNTKSGKKKKRCDIMTSNPVPMTQTEESHQLPEKQCTQSELDWTTVSSKSKRKAGKDSQSHNTYRPNGSIPTHATRPSSLKPTFCKYPVVVEDEKTTEAACLAGLKWQLPDTLRHAVGSVNSVKQISANKFLVGCTDSRQQNRLVALTSLGGINVTCAIPVPCVFGCISGIPAQVSEDEVLRRFELARDSEDNIIHAPPKCATRLNNRDNTPSLAFRITFQAAELPTSVIINKTEFAVKPYAPTVTRCYKCQRLGHLARSCPSKVMVCPTCGVPGHTGEKCTSTKRFCVNCRSDDHSSAYGGCLTRKKWSTANRLRSQSYMPKSAAFAQAKVVLAAQETRRAVNFVQAPSPPNSAWKSEESRTTARSPTYASVTASAVLPPACSDQPPAASRRGSSPGQFRQDSSPGQSRQGSNPGQSRQGSSTGQSHARGVQSMAASGCCSSANQLLAQDVQRRISPAQSFNPGQSIELQMPVSGDAVSESLPPTNSDLPVPWASHRQSHNCATTDSCNAYLKAENESLKQRISVLEKKISEMSVSHNEPSPSLLSSSLLQAIENAILSLVPTLVNRHLSQNPFIPTS
jgi:hypothetical protein